MRSKEEAHDYRYFPEPDFPPLKLDASWIAALTASLPELPHEKTLRFMREYQLSSDEAMQLTASLAMASYYTECAREAGNPRAVLNWITGDLAFALKNSGQEIEACPLAPQRLAALIRMVDSGQISGKIAKTVFEEIYSSEEEPAAVVSRLGLIQISDEASIAAAIDKALAANPRQLDEFRSGKDKLFGFFVGQVMKETKGQANPQLLNDLLKKKLRG